MPYSYQCRTCSLIQVFPLINPPLKFESRLVHRQNPHLILKSKKNGTLETWFPSMSTGKSQKCNFRLHKIQKFAQWNHFVKISPFLILFVINSIIRVVQLCWILKYGTQRQHRILAPMYPHDLCNYHHYHHQQTGENMAYSDNTCPHCGTTMDRD